MLDIDRLKNCLVNNPSTLSNEDLMYFIQCAYEEFRNVVNHKTLYKGIQVVEDLDNFGMLSTEEGVEVCGVCLAGSVFLQTYGLYSQSENNLGFFRDKAERGNRSLDGLDFLDSLRYAEYYIVYPDTPDVERIGWDLLEYRGFNIPDFDVSQRSGYSFYSNELLAVLEEFFDLNK